MNTLIDANFQDVINTGMMNNPLYAGQGKHTTVNPAMADMLEPNPLYSGASVSQINSRRASKLSSTDNGVPMEPNPLYEPSISQVANSSFPKSTVLRASTTSATTSVSNASADQSYGTIDFVPPGSNLVNAAPIQQNYNTLDADGRFAATPATQQYSALDRGNNDMSLMTNTNRDSTRSHAMASHSTAATSTYNVLDVTGKFAPTPRTSTYSVLDRSSELDNTNNNSSAYNMLAYDALDSSSSSDGTLKRGSNKNGVVELAEQPAFVL